MTDMMRAVLMLTPDQMLSSWVREQCYNRERGLPHYTRLTDGKTGAVVASIEHV